MAQKSQRRSARRLFRPRGGFWDRGALFWACGRRRQEKGGQQLVVRPGTDAADGAVRGARGSMTSRFEDAEVARAIAEREGAAALEPLAWEEYDRANR